MADTMLTPYDMGTVGSMTTPIMAPQLHKVAAAAREMLLDLAAENGKADRAALVIEDGRVRNTASGKSLSFGELTHGQKLTRTITADAHVTPATEWKIAGHDLRKINARAIVTGQEKFTSDMKLPGMMYGRVVRPAAFQASLTSVDTSAAERIPGVVAVKDGNFVGVAADDSSKLDRAAAAVRTDAPCSRISRRSPLRCSRPKATCNWTPPTTWLTLRIRRWNHAPPSRIGKAIG